LKSFSLLAKTHEMIETYIFTFSILAARRRSLDTKSMMTWQRLKITVAT